jgi:hypothetical protein
MLLVSLQSGTVDSLSPEPAFFNWMSRSRGSVIGVLTFIFLTGALTKKISGLMESGVMGSLLRLERWAFESATIIKTKKALHRQTRRKRGVGIMVGFSILNLHFQQ